MFVGDHIKTQQTISVQRIVRFGLWYGQFVRSRAERQLRLIIITSSFLQRFNPQEEKINLQEEKVKSQEEKKPARVKMNLQEKLHQGKHPKKILANNINKHSKNPTIKINSNSKIPANNINNNHTDLSQKQ